MPEPTDVTMTIDRRFRGPAASGNGGYTAGLFARLADLAATSSSDGQTPAPITVTLRRPPPLDVPMAVRRQSGAVAGDAAALPGAAAQLWYGATLVAEAAPGRFREDPVRQVSARAATAAAEHYRGAADHPFPECFVCGTGREPGDGMRLRPGIVAPGRTACVWVPDPDSTGSEFAWAALDCPGGWTSDIEARPLVLGRMTGAVLADPMAGVSHVVVGRLLGEDGRKTFTATSMYADGQLIAQAEQVWIAIDPATFQA